MERFGSAFGRMLSVLDRLEAEHVEVVIAGRDDDATRALVRAAHADFVPGLVVTGSAGGAPPSAAAPLLEGRSLVDGRPAAYVCVRYSCRLPVTEPADVLSALRETTDTPSSH